jgi:hypothetical protein
MVAHDVDPDWMGYPVRFLWRCGGCAYEEMRVDDFAADP